MIVSATQDILEGAANVTYVAHDIGGRWRFRPSGFLELPNSAFVDVEIDDILRHDRSVLELMDLETGWHAWRGTISDAWRRERQPTGKCYFVQIEATPRGSHPDTDEIGGATVNCWIIARTPDDAVAKAHVEIQSQGWITGAPDEVCEVEVSSGDEDDEDWQYVAQALVDGEVFVFHTFPVVDEPEC